MGKIVRKTINLSPSMHQKVLNYGEQNDCQNFSEIIRDIVRRFLYYGSIHNKSKKSREK